MNKLLPESVTQVTILFNCGFACVHGLSDVPGNPTQYNGERGANLLQMLQVYKQRANILFMCRIHTSPGWLEFTSKIFSKPASVQKELLNLNSFIPS
jgi:hypothetical protein